MSEHDLNDAVVELTAPDGQVFRFRYGATIPYAGQEYVVLLEMENDQNGEEQILITRVEEMEDGQLSFVVAEEEDVIQQVFDKYVALTIHNAVNCLEECDCGHEHCDCDHEHHHHDGCDCGCHHEE